MYTFTDRMYFDTRKFVTCSAKADVLGCIQRIRRVCALALLRERVSHSTVRLAMADVLESILCAEALRLAKLPEYLLLENPFSRELFLEHHLLQTHLSWMAERCAPADKDALEQLIREFFE